MTKAAERPKQRRVFRNKYLAALIAVMAFFLTGYGQVETRYSPISGTGFKYKRMVKDSVDIIPLSTSPHTPYRAGGIRYHVADSCVQVWTGTQWIKDNRAIQLTDTSFIIGNDTIRITGSGGGGGGGLSLIKSAGSAYRLVLTPDSVRSVNIAGTWLFADTTTDRKELRLGVDPQVEYGINIAPVTDVLSIDTTGPFSLVPQERLRDTSEALRAAIIAARPADSLQYFYVTRYGAVADSSTNNAAAFQAAVNAAKAAGGGVVFIPRGKWGLTSTVIVDTSNIVIRGSGAATEIWANTDFGDVFHFRPNIVPAPHANYFHDVGVYDLSIQSAVDRTSGYAIHTNFTHSATVANCVIGFMRTGHRNVITPFYMGVGFENESNAVMMNTQVYAWKKGVVFTGTAIGASFRNTNNFDGLITANCFIIGDTTKWHESDSTYGVHVGGGVGGVQIEQCNISFYTNGIRVDKQINNVPNAQFFIGHAFAADNCGAAGVHVGSNGIGEQFQVTGGWAAANGNAADAVVKDAIYIDPTGNNNLQTVIAGGTFRYNLVGSGINVGGGHVTITGAQFHDNDASDIVLGANVASATISGNTITSGIVNNSSIVPNFLGSGTTANPNVITTNTNASTDGLSFGNSSTGTGAAASFKLFNNTGPTATYLSPGVTGTNFTAYGALTSNTSYLYSSGNADKLLLMADKFNAPIVFAPGGNTEKIRFSANGRIGVGATTPGASVHVQGSDATSNLRMLVENTSNDNTVTASYDLKNDDTKVANFGMSSSTYSSSALIGANSSFFYTDAPSGMAIALNNATSSLRFSTGGMTERMRLTTSGNLLIGTTTDNGAKLQVNGRSSFVDTAALNARFSYVTNLGSTFTRYSLVDKNYVDSAIAAGSGGGSVTGTGASGRMALWSGASTLTSNSAILWGTSNGARMSIGTSNTQGVLNLGGDKDLSSSGVQSFYASATYTNTTTAASGTASNYLINYIAPPTIAAVNTGVIFPKIVTLAVDAPTAGMNATINNAYAIEASGNVKVNGNTEIDGSETKKIERAGDANASITTSSNIMILPSITSNRTLSLPATPKEGIVYTIINTNSSGNTWQFGGGGSLVDQTGAAVTSFTNGNTYIIMGDNTAGVYRILVKQ